MLTDTMTDKWSYLLEYLLTWL